MQQITGLKFNSLTFRLSFLFAITAILLLAGTGIFLYRFLDHELMKRDHDELIGKVDLFRHLLSTVDTQEKITAAPNLFRDVIIGHPHLSLTLLDTRGNILLTTTEWKPLQKLLENPIKVGVEPSSATISMHTIDSPYHAIAAWGALGSGRNDKVLIALALNVDEAQSLLMRYRQTLLITLLFSVITAAALAFIIARRGLRPLQAMAETASEISASHLQKRLSVTDAPTELKELAGAFNAMLGRLHHSFARLSDFSSDLAHELRTPINNLMGQTQVALSRQRNTEEYKSVLESNLEEYERLAKMIRDMLFLAQTDNVQPDNAPETLHTELVDLRTELDKVAEFYQMSADENGLKIIPSGSGTIFADRILVQRAISNLVSNALQHSPPNSKVHATVSSTDEGVELQVSNYGPGIPSEHLERIFDRFYRINNARSRIDTGSGLGLAIVRSIMDLHGGRVNVESHANQLTTFTLYFRKTSTSVTDYTA